MQVMTQLHASYTNYLHRCSAGKDYNINRDRGVGSGLVAVQAALLQASIPAKPADLSSVQLAGTHVGAEHDPDVVRSMVPFQLLDLVIIIIKEIGLAEFKH